jgi:hypothetical protein
MRASTDLLGDEALGQVGLGAAIQLDSVVVVLGGRLG